MKLRQCSFQSFKFLALPSLYYLKLSCFDMKCKSTSDGSDSQNTTQDNGTNWNWLHFGIKCWPTISKKLSEEIKLTKL